MNKQDKIYVAGHQGLVGSAVSRRLTALDYHNRVSRTHAELDLRDTLAVNRFFQEERPKYVYLCAARVGGIIANNTRRAEFLYDNIMITTNVIHAAKEYGVKKLLNLGSSCVYPRDAAIPFREDALLSGKLETTNEPYAIAKIAGIKFCRAMYEQYGCHYFSVMPPNLYGPSDNDDFSSSHVLPAMIRKLHLGKLLQSGNFEAIQNDLNRGVTAPITNFEELTGKLEKLGIRKKSVTLWGSGTPLREFLFVEDLAEALIMLMNTAQAEEIGEIINIGSSEEISLKGLANLIAEIVEYRGDIHWDRSMPDGVSRKLMDSTRIHALGWQPKVSLKQGIRRTYQQYLSTFSPEKS